MGVNDEKVLKRAKQANGGSKSTDLTKEQYFKKVMHKSQLPLYFVRQLTSKNV
jgi:hypothetical protein